MDMTWFPNVLPTSLGWFSGVGSHLVFLFGETTGGKLLVKGQGGVTPKLQTNQSQVSKNHEGGGHDSFAGVL